VSTHMTECERVGINGNCGPECPVFQRGGCEEEERAQITVSPGKLTVEDVDAAPGGPAPDTFTLDASNCPPHYHTGPGMPGRPPENAHAVKRQYIPSNEEVRQFRDAFAADADGLAEKSPGPEAVWNRKVSLAMNELLVMRELHENAREGMGRVRDAVSDLNSAVRRIRS